MLDAVGYAEHCTLYACIKTFNYIHIFFFLGSGTYPSPSVTREATISNGAWKLPVAKRLLRKFTVRYIIYYI